MNYGITKRIGGTVLANNVNGEVVVQFDKTGGDEWYSGEQQLMPCRSGERVKMTIGLRVVLEYETSPRRGLWYARTLKPGETI